MRRGAGISTLTMLYVQVLSLVQTLVIARILTPTQVGIFTAGTVLAGFLATFSDGGMRNALIQRRENIEDAANTVFWASLGFGVAWAGTAAAVAPVISWLFSSDLAGLVCLATAGTIVLHVLTNVPDALMQRRFDFRQRLIVQPSYTTSYAITSISLCAAGAGIWGLVIASYVSYVVWITTSWSLARWRPGVGGRASYRMWRELARFSYPLVIGALAERGRDVFETSVVGSVLNTTALGHYRYGRRIASLPDIAVIEVGSYVLFPAFARIVGDTERFRSAFLRALRVLWCLTIPLAGFIVAMGEPGVTVLLGEPWRGAGVMLVALAGSGPGMALSAVGCESIKASGRTRLLNWVTAVGALLGVGLLLALLPLGLVGVGLALSVSAFSAGLTSVLLARRLNGVALGEISHRLLPPLAVGAIASAAVWALDRYVGHADHHGFLLGFAIILGEGVLFLAIYFGGLRLGVPSAWQELRGAVLKARSREQR
jgi:PST family polysaccharide transporter